MPDLNKTEMQNLLKDFSRRLDKLERYAASGRFLSYTPTFTATTVNPTLGTGSKQAGRWARWGNLVYARGIILFGSAGVAAGTGTYAIGVPVAASGTTDTALNLGHVRLAQGSLGASAATSQDLLFTAGSTTFTMRYPAASPTGADTAVTNANPWIWAANHSLQFQVLYEAAE